MAEHDYSRTPTPRDLGDPTYMGPRTPGGYAPAAAPQAPINLPPFAGAVEPIDFGNRVSGPVSPPAPPVPLGSSIRMMATVGLVLGALYAFLGGIAGSWWVVGAWGVGGAAAGATAAVVFWILGKLLDLTVWVLCWALKIALFAAAGYMFWFAFLR